MQARFYAPWYGRFLSPDPARDQHFEETQSWNIYSYCENNPTMRVDMDGMAWGWADQALDKVANGLAAVHVGLQSIPVLGTAYAGGARLGEAISGSKVEYSSLASGPKVQELSLDQRSQSAFDGTKTVGTLVAAGAVPGATSLTTGTTVTTQGAVATTGVVVGNGSVAGAAAMAMTGESRSGSSKNEKHGDSGRAETKAEKQIDKLKQDLGNAKTRSEKRFLEQKIKNIQRAAEKAKKGEEHSRGAKG